MLRIIIIIFMLLVSRFLSTRERAWLGAIVPTIYIIVIAVLLTNIELKDFSEVRLPIILGLIIFLGIWIDGRESHKKKRKKELDKIKSQDM